MFDAQGHLKASSIASGHRRDPLSGLIMPTTVRINVPPAQFSMRIDLGNVQVNRVAGNPNELWVPPDLSGLSAGRSLRPEFALCSTARPRRLTAPGRLADPGSIGYLRAALVPGDRAEAYLPRPLQPSHMPLVSFPRSMSAPCPFRRSLLLQFCLLARCRC